MEYFRPARLDDQVAVHSVLTEVSGARIKALQRVRRGESLLVEGRIEACITTLMGKPRRLPGKVYETLAPLVTAEET
jgi:acyl-CoA thioester hydrolase